MCAYVCATHCRLPVCLSMFTYNYVCICTYIPAGICIYFSHASHYVCICHVATYLSVYLRICINWPVRIHIYIEYIHNTYLYACVMYICVLYICYVYISVTSHRDNTAAYLSFYLCLCLRTSALVQTCRYIHICLSMCIYKFIRIGTYLYVCIHM